MPSATWRACWIATVARPGSGLPSAPARLAHVADRRDLGMAGTVRSGLTSIRPPRSVLAPVAPRQDLGQPGGAHAGRPDDGPRGDPLVCPPALDRHPVGVDRRDPRCSRARVTPSAASSRAAFAESFSLNAGTTRSPASSRITSRPLGSIRGSRASSRGGRGSRAAPATSTPVGPPPTTDEREPLVPGGRVGRPLGLLERAEDAVAQLDRVGKRLQAAGRVSATRRGRSRRSRAPQATIRLS